MDKSPDAFRTISEVGDLLETPAHVLRFWESRFPQIRPVKRAGGRRYYRPADVALLTGIKRLLHDEGLTIRGVQKLLRENGVRHVAGLSGADYPEDDDLDAEAALEEAMALNFGNIPDAELEPEEAATATVFALETALKRQDAQPGANVMDVRPTSAVIKSLRPQAEPAPEPQPEDPAPEVELWTDDHPDQAEAETAEVMPIAAQPPVVDSPAAAQPIAHPPEEELDLLDRLRALPALALARSPEARQLLQRLQALHQGMLDDIPKSVQSR